MAFPDLRLCLLFTPALCRAEPWATLPAALDGGVDLVQWRQKTTDADGLRRCLALCRPRGVPVIVNDHVLLALRTGADGAHVGQDDMPAGGAGRLLDGRWLGVSTHDTAQIKAAAEHGADYVGFGPCFPSATKGYTEGQLPGAITAAVRTAQDLALPLFAIGGITPANLPSLLSLGVRRIAVSGAILQAEEPRTAARALRRRLDG